MSRAIWQDYLELCKPRVVLLMLLTSYVGMHLATTTWVPWRIIVFGTVGIALCAGSAAVINHLVDRQIDAVMGRTKQRPIPTGKIIPRHAVLFSVTIGIVGLAVLTLLVNPLTAFLTLLTLLSYAVFYSMFLKHVTPQNIVIGGIAGAAPPLLGWTAVTDHVSAQALLLVLIIYAWTPPHFWALSLYRYEEYARADVPMLPVTHGIPYTKLHILLYTLLLIAVTMLPYAIGMSGLVYLACASVLNAFFLYFAVKLYFSKERKIAIATFRYSIIYLMLLFFALLLDHYL